MAVRALRLSIMLAKLNIYLKGQLPHAKYLEHDEKEL